MGRSGKESADVEAASPSPSPWYARAQGLVGRLGVEQRGIERVPEDERTDTSTSTVGTLWFSVNMAVTSFAVGALAVPVFSVGFVDAALTLIFFNALGILPVAFFSTFGPAFGLRQMVLSRFWFGYHGVKLVALFNLVACLGWSSVNVMVGAQLLRAVNPAVPGWAGVLVISACTLLITMFGYRLVHAYERWSWAPLTAVFLVVLGAFARSGAFVTLLPLRTGPAEAGAVLSFGASVFAFATGWTALAADYTVYQPADGPRRRRALFLWAAAGLFASLVPCDLLGVAVGTATASDAAYARAYRDGAVGGLLAAVLVPPLGRFGDFCLVLLALSVVANNCPNLYSIPLSVQVLGPGALARVPRLAWTVLATCACVAVAAAGYDHFEAWLENLLLLVGYWLAAYEGVALADHFVFRRGLQGYRAADHTDPQALPPGLAALAAFCVGVVGAALGMAQAWWTGPIGRLCGGDFGGDVGFELAFACSALSYVVLRAVEKRCLGR